MSDNREQKIRDKAYSLWEEGGSEHGRHEEHWRRAEQDIADDRSQQGAPPQDQPAEGGSRNAPTEAGFSAAGVLRC